MQRAHDPEINAFNLGRGGCTGTGGPRQLSMVQRVVEVVVVVHTGAHWCTLVHTGAHWCALVHTGAHWCSTLVHPGATPNQLQPAAARHHRNRPQARESVFHDEAAGSLRLKILRLWRQIKVFWVTAPLIQGGGCKSRSRPKGSGAAIWIAPIQMFWQLQID